jgi:DMSO/TMAO reductase YedYZ molybdopterin-dependent catalytic subunit
MTSTRPHGSPSVCQRVIAAFEQQSSGPAVPAYLRIERAVHRLIADGTLRPGQRLPTVRELAQALSIATNTAAHAYAELADEGAIVSRSGGGTVVAARTGTVADRESVFDDRLQRSARHFVAYSLALGHAPAEVIHAVRAELAALGRAEPTLSADQPIVIRNRLPVHAVPTEIAQSDLRDSLAIEGHVRCPGQLTENELRELPRARLEQPFACDEGWVVPSLCWAGVWLNDVLALARPLPGATGVRVCAGSYSMPLSIGEASSALLANELDDLPLTVEHGAPWRLLVPGAACYTSVKWVDRLEVTEQLKITGS